MTLVEIYWSNRLENRRPDAADRLFADRNDWVIYRLCLDRPAHWPFELPAHGESSTILLDNLHAVSNSENVDLKVTAVGMVAKFLSTSLTTSSEKRCLRVSKPANQYAVIDDRDRLTEETLRRLLSWMKQRVAKLTRAIRRENASELTLMNCRKRGAPCDVEAAKAIEARLILALANMAIVHAELELDSKFDVERLESALGELQRIGGGPRFGMRIQVQNLNHNRMVGRHRVLAPSCYLPITHGAYDLWIAAVFGHLAHRTTLPTTLHERIVWGMLSLRHREAVYRREQQKERKQVAANSLATALTRVYGLLIEARNLVGAAQLAARFLYIFNGLEERFRTNQRIGYASRSKGIALVMGLVINDEIRDTDLSAKRSQTIESNEQAKARARLVDAVGDAEAAMEKTHHGADDEDDVSVVARSLGLRRGRHDSDCEHAVLCLRKINHEVCRSASGERLADARAFESAFRLSQEWRVAGNLLGLFRLAMACFPEHLAHFNSADVVMGIAECLKYVLDRPYMEDVVARRAWQWTLWDIYQRLSQEERAHLSGNAKLLIYSTVAHVQASTLRVIPDARRDSIEDSPVQETIENEDEDYDALDQPMGGISTVNRIAVDERAMRDLLLKYRAGAGETSIVQFVLSQDGRCMHLILFGLRDVSVVHAEARVEIAPCRQEEEYWETWDDIAADARMRLFYDFRGAILPVTFGNTVLGSPSVVSLWEKIKCTATGLLGRLPTHLCLIPDARVANLPWQWVAVNCKKDGEALPLVSLLHGIRWGYAAACLANLDTWVRASAMKIHASGVNARWISEEAIPDDERDCRVQVRNAFAVAECRGVSMSVVFDHGIKEHDFTHTKCNAVGASSWSEIRGYRICVLLSCETGVTEASGLGDAAGLSNYLCRHAKAVLAPPVAVPYTAAVTLAEAFKRNLQLAYEGNAIQVRHVYQEAISNDPLVALFSLWGLPHEPLVWQLSCPTPDSLDPMDS